MSRAATGTEIERIDPDLARSHIEDGEAMLVCAYDSEDKCRQYYLEGAIPVAEFERVKDSVAPDKEIIFYCA
jgi:hypothetical protein